VLQSTSKHFEALRSTLSTLSTIHTKIHVMWRRTEHGVALFDPSPRRPAPTRARQRFAHTPLATAPLLAELIRTAVTSLMDTPVDTETGLCSRAPTFRRLV